MSEKSEQWYALAPWCDYVWNLLPASLRKSCDHLAKAKLRKNKVTTQDDKIWGSFKTIWQIILSKEQDDVDNLKDRCACASSQVEDVDALLAITQDVVNCLNRGLEWGSMQEVRSGLLRMLKRFEVVLLMLLSFVSGDHSNDGNTDTKSKSTLTCPSARSITWT